MSDAPSPAAVVERLVRERPAFHSVEGRPQVWNAAPETLAMIARHVRPDATTLETGAGASTVVFAAAGARHTAISPHAGEHDRIREWCRAAGIPDEGLSFVAGRSDAVLPALELPERLDAALIDGKHSFPHPVIDWHYVGLRLRPGGMLFVDDIPVSSVGVVVRAMIGSAEWELLEIADDRAAAFRKLAEPPSGDDWRGQPFNRRFPDFSFAPQGRRARLRLGHAGRRLRAALGRRVVRRGRG